jgi:hypothetical protein
MKRAGVLDVLDDFVQSLVQVLWWESFQEAQLVYQATDIPIPFVGCLIKQIPRGSTYQTAYLVEEPFAPFINF